MYLVPRSRTHGTVLSFVLLPVCFCSAFALRSVMNDTGGCPDNTRKGVCCHRCGISVSLLRPCFNDPPPNSCRIVNESGNYSRSSDGDSLSALRHSTLLIVSYYSRTSLLRINCDGEAFGCLENPDYWIFL